MQRRHMLVMMAGVATGGTSFVQANPRSEEPGCSRQTHIDWVAEALKRMQTITAGMTRQELLKVFTTEGGLSSRLNRTFVSRDCPFFKVDVEFQPIGRAARDGEKRVTLDEDRRDIILKVSPPYMQFSIMD